MRCYRCTRDAPVVGGWFREVREAVGICQQCGEGVCLQHGVKAAASLPVTNGVVPSDSTLKRLLCLDCYASLMSKVPAK